MSISLEKGDKGTLVLWLQDALNRVHKQKLVVDGDFGKKTEDAVKDFQNSKGLKVDGKPGKITFKALGMNFGKIKKNGISKQVCWLLPSKGNGFVTYNRDGNDQFGTEDTIARFMNYVEKFEKDNKTKVEIGNISRFGGGVHNPHKSHRNGQQIDIRPLRGDGKTGSGLTFKSGAYSRQLTQKFVDMVRKDSPGVIIFFNDRKVKGVTPLGGHDNHLHFSFSKVKAKHRLNDGHFKQKLAESPLKI